MSVPAFQLAETPLVPGVTLIEASAGTGKTFALAGVVLRLVLEQRIPIREILAVTFTEAATAELRDRVRTRLRDALAALRLRDAGDPIVAKFLATGDVARGIRDLDAAVESFDEAQIFTIHGFCHRMLRDHAFECGARFEAELVTDPAPMFEEVARDFWRRSIATASPLIARLALARKVSPDCWLPLSRHIRNHRAAPVLPPAGGEDCAAIEKRLDRAFAAARTGWKKSAAEVSAILNETRALSVDKSISPFHMEGVAEILRLLAQLFDDFDNAPPACFAALEKLSTSSIRDATKDNHTPPEHAFFELCETFSKLAKRFFQRLAHEFLDYQRDELPSRKARANTLTHDDLLTHLRDALCSARGNELAVAMRGQYRAALIDEFQDTDPVQCEIFQRAFASGEGILMYIGDPKQAIYSFRGADVLAYLAAAKGTRRFKLETNWRSEPELIAAMNDLFLKTKSVFDVEGIDYVFVRAPAEPKKNFRRLVEPDTSPPLRFRLLQQEGEKPVDLGGAEKIIRRAVVADIARMHAGGARLGEARLRLRDMAVLVRTNNQAAALQADLRAAGIKSVLRSDKSVFETPEAVEVQRVLDAVVEPGRAQLLKTALSTSLLAVGATEIAALDGDEKSWTDWAGRFLGWRERWERTGFIAMFRRLLVDRDTRGNLVKLPAGERKLTNFLHIAELLQQAEAEERLAPEALCAWLRSQRSESATTSDARQIRLESDGDAVLLTTVHRSKGLEYPVVFCPFLWKGGPGGRDPVAVFHNAKRELTIDFGSDELAAHKAIEETERAQESMRLLYVAITRAQNRCFIYAGPIKNIEKSAMGRLIGAASPDAVKAAVERLAAESNGSIGSSEVDPDGDALVKFSRVQEALPDDLRARVFHGSIPETVMVGSFTALTSERNEETPDRDAVAVSPGVEPESDPLALFSPGARTGLFFHDVLEVLDFQDAAALEPLVSRKLAAHGISAPGAREAACAQIRRVLETPLESGVALRGVASSDRLAEVEFSYPAGSGANPFDAEKLRAVFARHGGPAMPAEIPSSLGRLRFNPVDGYLRGFIDLLFRSGGRYFLADWKTNALDNYDDAGVRACMAQHCYHLQYHLYTVAADLFLKSRVPGYDYARDFGGVFYIFLRGIDPLRPGRAIFRDRPEAALVNALEQTMKGGAS